MRTINGKWAGPVIKGLLPIEAESPRPVINWQPTLTSISCPDGQPEVGTRRIVTVRLADTGAAFTTSGSITPPILGLPLGPICNFSKVRTSDVRGFLRNRANPSILGKGYNRIIHGQCVRSRQIRMMIFFKIFAKAQEPELIEYEWNAFGREGGTAIRQLQMQMCACSIA
jgi:hypothetical protein